MKNSYFYLTLLSIGILNIFSSAKADWTHWGVNHAADEVPATLYLFNRDTGKSSLINTDCEIRLGGDGSGGDPECAEWSSFGFDDSLGKLIITRYSSELGGEVDYYYDEENDSWELIDNSWSSDYEQVLEIPLIRRDSDNGITSIGLNSLNFQETDKKLNLWGTNISGERVPVNVTTGLLIKGRDVEQSINNVGAMSAALTGLPTVPTDTKIACGLGTGTHGGDFAFSGGCASKVNEKLSINYAASTIMPGKEYAGDFEDHFSARAGFVWQLGKSNKPTQISMNQKKEMDLKISKLENDNEELKHENQKIISKYIQLENKNNEIISQNTKLLARLKKLENIAFKLHKNYELKLSKGVKGNN